MALIGYVSLRSVAGVGLEYQGKSIIVYHDGGLRMGLYEGHSLFDRSLIPVEDGYALGRPLLDPIRADRLWGCNEAWWRSPRLEVFHSKARLTQAWFGKDGPFWVIDVLDEIDGLPGAEGIIHDSHSLYKSE